MSDDIVQTPEPDPVAGLLAPRAGPESALRQPLRDRTVRLLGRRRRLRRLAILTAVAAAFLLGLLLPRPAPRPSPPPTETTVAPTPPEPPPVEKRPEAPPSALVLEWRAFDGVDADLYRQAGQRYLRDDNDPLSAVRCYRQSLNAASPDALTVSADDDWLLMALKDARQREKPDAKPY
jgi:hypothetical protein